MLGCWRAFSISASSLNLCLSALDSFRSWKNEERKCFGVFFTIIYASTSIEYKETVLVSLTLSTHLISLYFASNKPDFYLFKVVSNNSSARFLRDFQPSPFFIGMFACLFVKPCNTDL